MDTLLFAAVAVSAVAILTVVLFLLFAAKKDAFGNFGKMLRRPPKRETEDVCGICFGTISKTDAAAECGCGQVFHDACAGPTGTCPYCGTSYDKLSVEAPERITCPSCGSGVEGGVCACGAVVNRDGTFTCECGEPLDVNDPVCGKCGASYDVRSGRGQ